MVEKISAKSLNNLREKNVTHALMDVREKTEYEKRSILGASIAPRRLLEYRISHFVPAKNTKVILCDDDGRRAKLAAHTLEKNGYTNVFYLDGGIEAWEEEGYLLVDGLNVTSKALGELVAKYHDVPELDANKVKELMDKGEDIVIIEVRPYEEARKSGSLPGAINIPGFDLSLKIFDYVKEGRKIVMTCAGRTRSIIATQTLRLMGIDEVYDFKNGIMGWLLNGFELQKEICPGSKPSEYSIKVSKEVASRLSREESIEFISVEKFQSLFENTQETSYFFDVRSKEEYEAGHIPGTISVPGGQVIQLTDEVISVRQGNIVLICDEFVRAVITAYWCKQLGFNNVFVLEGGVYEWQRKGLQIKKGSENILPIGYWERKGLQANNGSENMLPIGYNEALNRVRFIAANSLKNLLEQNSSIVVVDVSISSDFERGHIKDSHWISRGWLEFKIGDVASQKDFLCVICSNGVDSILAAVTLEEMGYENVSALEGGFKAWKESGFPVESGSAGIIDEPDDVFVKSYERTIGMKEAMERFLTWEENISSEKIYQDHFKNFMSKFLKKPRGF